MYVFQKKKIVSFWYLESMPILRDLLLSVGFRQTFIIFFFESVILVQNYIFLSISLFSFEPLKLCWVFLTVTALGRNMLFWSHFLIQVVELSMMFFQDEFTILQAKMLYLSKNKNIFSFKCKNPSLLVKFSFIYVDISNFQMKQKRNRIFKILERKLCTHSRNMNWKIESFISKNLYKIKSNSIWAHTKLFPHV